MDSYEKINILFNEILLLQDRVEDEKKYFKGLLEQTQDLKSINKQLESNLSNIDESLKSILLFKNQIQSAIDGINLNPITQEVEEFLDKSTKSIKSQNEVFAKDVNSSKDEIVASFRSLKSETFDLYKEIQAEKLATKALHKEMQEQNRIYDSLYMFGLGFGVAAFIFYVGFTNGWL